VAVCVYKVLVDIDGRVVEIKESVDTNYKDGEAKQLANLFYRAMLARGHAPTVACNALAGIAQAGGLPVIENQDDLFTFGQHQADGGGGDE